MVLKNRLAGKIGTDEPPATTAFRRLPLAIPPQYSSLFKNSSTGNPRSISYTPGLRTLPPADISLVPVLRPIPILAYSSPPSLIIGTTAAIDSTLFTTVGQPYKPAIAGNGGLMRGLPRLPSSDSSNAVSSPQMYAPAPTCTKQSCEKLVPKIFCPKSPAA